MMWKSSKILGESFENHRETIGGNIGQPWESQGHHKVEPLENHVGSIRESSGNQ